MEDRRNNRRLATVSCIIWILQIWWLSPFATKCFPVQTEDYFYQVVRYVERNALRANLVGRAESWRWSSLRRVEREDPAFPILSTWPLPRPTDWLQLAGL